MHEEHSRTDHEEAYVHSWAPLHRVDFLIERPPLHFATHDDLPKTHNSLLVRAHSPSTIWTDRNATHSSTHMRKFEGFVIRERPQGVRTRQLWNEAVRVDVQFRALNPRREIQIQ